MNDNGPSDLGLGRLITNEINADPEEIRRLRESRQQAREGKRRRWQDVKSDWCGFSWLADGVDHGCALWGEHDMHICQEPAPGGVGPICGAETPVVIPPPPETERQRRRRKRRHH